MNHPNMDYLNNDNLSDDDDDDDDDEIRFEPAIPIDPKQLLQYCDHHQNHAILPHNTTTSNLEDTTGTTGSFYYADEASLYSIAENSREDTIDQTTTTTTITTTNTAATTPILPVVSVMNDKNIDNDYKNPTNTTTTTTVSTNSGGGHGNISMSNSSNSHNSHYNNNNTNHTNNTNSSQTTSPINNVTSFELRKESGIELSYAGQRYNNPINKNHIHHHDHHHHHHHDLENHHPDAEVITKASDETFRTYFYSNQKQHGSLSLCQRWYHPKCRIMILLLIVLLIGIVFLVASLTIYHVSNQKQQMKSINSIESGGNDSSDGSNNNNDNNDMNTTTPTPTMAPSSTFIRNNNNNKPTSMPISSNELKYIVSENYVYNSIKTCQGTGTFFDISTIQGQVFELLVQEVSDHVTVLVDDTTPSVVPTYEFASYHTTTYLREKYSLNVFYLSTNGPTTWNENTNWMTTTNPCTTTNDISSLSSSSSLLWYGVECSNTSSSTSNSDTISSAATTVTTKSSISSSSSTTCDSTASSEHHITTIDLSNNNLSGILPNELCCLPCVERIDLSHNNITGDFVWCINEIVTLKELNISFNPLMGGGRE